MSDRPRDIPPTRVVELVANLDDATGERLGHACAALLAEGALDVWTTPITMKQGRPGVQVSVLAPEHDRARFAALVIEATGSFGVRTREWDRVVLDREWAEVQTRLGPVRLKVGRLDGRAVVVKPEFADVVRLAEDARVPLPEAQSTAAAAADAWRAEHAADGHGVARERGDA